MENYINKRIVFFPLLGLLFSCSLNNKRWENKEILFPKDIVFTYAGKDSTEFDFNKTKWKFFIYADTTNCMGCKLYLDRWNMLIAETKENKELKDSVSFIFCLFPKDLEEIKFILDCDLPDYPVCIDTNNKIGKLNKFSSDMYFLLDKENKVVLSGNPISSTDISDLYFQKLKGVK